MASSTDLLGELVQLMQDTQVVCLCYAAAMAWLACDIVTTLPQEVALIWGARWSIPKVFYFLVRYYTLVTLSVSISVSMSTTVSSAVCARYIWYSIFNGTLFTGVIGEAMFLMRLWASYERSKIILVLICSTYSAQLIAGVVVACLSILSSKALDRPPELPIQGCLYTPPKFSHETVACWACTLLTTSLYFLLVLYKFANSVSLRRKSSTTTRLSVFELESVSPIIYAFIRDSAFYFFLVFLGNLVNLMALILFPDRALYLVGFCWLSVVYSVSASRLCLNTRESLRGSSTGNTTFESETGWFDHDPIELPDCPLTAASFTISNSASRRASIAPPGALVVLGQSNVSGRLSKQCSRVEFECGEQTRRLTDKKPEE